MTNPSVTVRAARPGDQEFIRRAFGYTGAQLIPLMEKSIGERKLGSAIRARAQGTEAFRSVMATAGSNFEGFKESLTFSSTILVAADGDGKAVGMAALRPTEGLIMQMMQRYPHKSSEIGIRGLFGTSKLVALGVDPTVRSQGIGRILLDAVVDQYRQADMSMIYGIIEEEKASRLTRFYEQAGFHVLEPGGVVNFSHTFGERAFLNCDPGKERIFYLDLEDGESRRWEGPKLSFGSQSKSANDPSGAVVASGRVKGHGQDQENESAQGMWQRIKRVLRSGQGNQA